MKIKGFPNSSGSGQWRLIHPFKYLNKIGHQAVYRREGEKDEFNDLKQYDILIPQGVVSLDALTMMLELKRDCGVKIVMDFDDMIQVTPDNPNYKDHMVMDSCAILSSFAKFVDGITCTNEYLAEDLRKLNKNVYIVPNYMDLEYWKLPLPERGEKVRICYVGSVTHLLDLTGVADSIKRVLDKYGDKIELFMVGDLRWKEVFKGYPNVECFLGVPFDSYAHRLNGLAMDIGIAPLNDTPFNRSKSPIKWMENTIAGGVTLASPTVYSNVIKEGINGFIAQDSDEWFDKLCMLIDNKELRQKVWSNAYNEVINDYSLEKNIKEWEKVYQEILK